MRRVAATLLVAVAVLCAGCERVIDLTPDAPPDARFDLDAPGLDSDTVADAIPFDAFPDATAR